MKDKNKDQPSIAIPLPDGSFLRAVGYPKLMSKDEFVEKLFDDGGTFTALTNLCEDNEVDFGTPLYWMHPYTDGLYNGCYFALVREGVLVRFLITSWKTKWNVLSAGIRS